MHSPPLDLSAETHRPALDYEAYHSIGGETMEQQEAGIRRTLAEYGLADRVDLVRVGESGFALLGFPETTVGGAAVVPERHQPAWQPHVEGTEPRILVDADDSLIDYSGGKRSRDAKFAEIAGEQAGLAQDAATTLMKTTDDFARWAEGEGPDLYHDQAHELAIGWCLEQLAAGVSVDDIRAGFQRVAGGEREGAPFYFDGHRLICDNPEQLINATTQAIFAPIRHPKLFTDAARSFQLMRAYGAEPSICTRGRPGFQLPKLMRPYHDLAAPYKSQDHPFSPYGEGWPFENVLLTVANKGTFLSELRQLAQTDERIKRAFFDDRTHALLVFDDSQSEHNSIARARESIEADSGALVGTVPSLRPGTGNSKKWAGRSARHILRTMQRSGHETPFIQAEFGQLIPVLAHAVVSVLGRALGKDGQGQGTEAEALRAQSAYFAETAARFARSHGQDWIDRHLSGRGRVARVVGRVLAGLGEGRN